MKLFPLVHDFFSSRHPSSYDGLLKWAISQGIISHLEKSLNYTFKNKKHLLTSLIHKSFANELNLKSFEVLEFLGDSCLNFIVTHTLTQLYREDEQGELSKLKSFLCSGKSFLLLAKTIHLQDKIFVGRGMLKNYQSSIITDCFEAIIGAVVCDNGISQAEKSFFSYY